MGIGQRIEWTFQWSRLQIWSARWLWANIFLFSFPDELFLNRSYLSPTPPDSPPFYFRGFTGFCCDDFIVREHRSQGFLVCAAGLCEFPFFLPTPVSSSSATAFVSRGPFFSFHPLPSHMLCTPGLHDFAHEVKRSMGGVIYFLWLSFWSETFSALQGGILLTSSSPRKQAWPLGRDFLSF